MKLKPIYRHGDQSPDRKPVQYAHWCPACDEPHIFSLDGPKGRNWTFDGNMEKPTFEPSMRISCDWDPEAKAWRATQCHYYLRNGMLEFCRDHPKAEFRNRSFPLPDFPNPHWGETA